MIVTFCGHSDYIGSKSEEERLLSLLCEIIGGENAEFYLVDMAGHIASINKLRAKTKNIKPNYISKCDITFRFMPHKYIDIF